MHTIRSVVIELIKQRQVNPTVLSKDADIPRTTIQQILSGTTYNPRMDTCIKLAKYFNIPINTLIGFENPTSQEKLNEENTDASIPISSWEDAVKRVNRGYNQTIMDCGRLSLTDNLSTKCFGLKIKEDKYFIFPKNSIVIIDPEHAIMRDKDFVLISNNNSNPVIKQIHKECDKIYLVSHIKGMPSLEFKKPIEFVGKVVKFVKTLI